MFKKILSLKVGILAFEISFIITSRKPRAFSAGMNAEITVFREVGGRSG